MKSSRNSVSTILLFLLSLGLVGCVGEEPEPPPTAEAPTSGDAAAQDASDSADAAKLLQAVDKKYGAMKSFKAEGTTDISIKGMNPSVKGMNTSQATSFSIALIRDPRTYRIHWKNQAGPVQMAGTLWNSGDGPNFDMGVPGFGGKEQDEMMAFAKAAGVSGGAAATIPPIFYQDAKLGQAPMPDSGQFKGEETIDGVKCRIVESSVGPGLVQRFWIDDQSLIRRKQDKMDMGAMELPEMTAELYDETLKKMGKEPNEQNRAELKATMDEAREYQNALQTASATTTLTQDYTNIEVNPELNPADFAPKSQ